MLHTLSRSCHSHHIADPLPAPAEPRALFARACRWAWNANSGDTGGIVSGTTSRGVSAAWYTVKMYKIRYLQERLGLCPWFQGPC